ncbi:MAG: porin [Microcystis wesenbergii TW10]|uniref:Porin n=1 Tax=Microcystis wesenbergii TW10 TaxID=2060474 RepID=A0A3E0LN23_9CHRO|nr:MAG: porin [Microcystis wesenbergii TW10]
MIKTQLLPQKSALLSLGQLGIASLATIVLTHLSTDVTRAQLSHYSSLSDSQPMSQINSVSSLRDVEPTDWAYTALQSLVDRYGCIAGYPDRTYRGNRAMTRYEFAAGLNACMDKLTELVSSSFNVLKEDIDALKRLQQEFRTELANLGLRVDKLESSTASLENRQFSTTTRLNGSVSISAAAYASGEGKREATLQQQSFLQFATSFTGKDLLSTGFFSSTSALPQLAPFNDGRNVGFTNEGFTIWAYAGDTQSRVLLGTLEYIFPLVDNGVDRWYLTLTAADGFNTSRYLLPRGSLTWEGYNLSSGPISAFGQRSPLYRLGGGTGLITNYDRGPWRFTFAYLASQANSPRPGEGLFNGDSLTLTQLNYTPSGNFAMAITYFNNYFGPGRFAFNNQYKFDADSPGFVGTALANRFDNAGVFFDRDVPVTSNTYGLQAFYRVSPGFVLGGFAANINARLIGRGDAQLWTYALSLAFPDLGKEGNLAGVIVGVEPTLTGLQAAQVPAFKQDTPIHVEGFYQYQVNNNLSITPGFIWIVNPNQDASNQDIFVGVLRSTFSF